MEGEEMRKFLTADTIKAIIQYRTKFPKMSNDDIGKLTDVSGSTARRVLLLRDAVLIYPEKMENDITRDVQKYGSRILDVLCGMYNKPYRDVMALYTAKEEKSTPEEKEEAPDSKPSNESVYLMKVLEQLALMSESMASIKGELESLRQEVNANADSQFKVLDGLRDKVDRIKKIKT